MKKITVILFLLISIIGRAQSFSGSIEFKHYTLRDTSNNMYWVKGDKVKLDQYSKKSTTIEGSFIFNLTDKKINFVNPKRKVWGDQKSEIPPIIKGKCEVTKSGKTKTIEGVKCTEYIVKNTEENTVISYWIASDKYDFFVPMMQMWNRKDKQSVYFCQIKDLPKGSMPFLSEERQISDNKVISKLEVQKLSKGGVEDEKLSIPADYKKFDQ